MVGSVIDNPYKVKAGTLLSWPNVTIPAGWLVCDGSAISRTTYKSLFDVIGETYGTGDGTTTFNLPNGNIPLGITSKVETNGKGIVLTDGTYGFNIAMHGTAGGANGVFLQGSNALANTSNIGTARNSASIGQTTGILGFSTQTGLVADLTNTTCATKTLIKY